MGPDELELFTDHDPEGEDDSVGQGDDDDTSR